MSTLPDREPVLSAQTVNLILLGAVAVGWASWDNTQVMAIASGVAALASVGSAFWARAKVTPLVRRWLEQG